MARTDAVGVASRRVALKAITEVHAQQAWTSPVLDRVLDRAGLDGRDRTFAANLVFSTIRMEGTLDWILAQVVTRPLATVDAAVLDVLRAGTWELRYGGAPSHAVVSAWVDVATNVVGRKATGFVNGVLRNVDRTADALPWPDEATPEGMALATGNPTWLAQMAVERFGTVRARAVLDAGNVAAPLTLRAVAPRDQVLERLAADDVDASPGTTPEAIVLTDRHQVSELAVVTDGAAVVQDQSSQIIGRIVADLAWASAGARGAEPPRVLDLCAAPGGKALHLAQTGADVTAVDRHAGRLGTLDDTAQRLGLSVRTLVADGADTGLEPASFDVVLVDAPCSGLGVVRRRPELRWRKTPDDVVALSAVQHRLLTAAAALVRPDGHLVYSVCTWTAAETDPVVDGVSAGSDLRIISPPPWGTATEHGRQMVPDQTEGDGMYVAVMAPGTAGTPT